MDSFRRYHNLQYIARSYGHKSTCAIISYALVWNVPYDIAHQDLVALGWENDGGVSLQQLMYSRLHLNRMTVENVPEVNMCFRGYAITPGHMSAIIEGTVIDYLTEYHLNNITYFTFVPMSRTDES